MRRDFAQPFDAGILHGDVRVEAPCDSARDESGALLLKQLDQPLLPRHQPIDLRRLAIQESSDGALLGQSEVKNLCVGNALAVQEGCPVNIHLGVARDENRCRPEQVTRIHQY